MINPNQPRDIPQVLLSVLFLSLIIISCLWVVQPFILSFAWAGTVVIATWPVLLRLQSLLFGKRSLAVLVMTLLLFLLFVIPIALLVNSLVDNSVPLIKVVTSGNFTPPDLAWLPLDILKNATGEELHVAPYLDYLNKKFGDLYGF